MSLYYEIHVTVEFPQMVFDKVGDSILSEWEDFALEHGWHMGKLLLMKGTGERSHKDLFFTTRSIDYSAAMFATREFVAECKEYGFKVLRYKIEDTMLDSNIVDALKIL